MNLFDRRVVLLHKERSVRYLNNALPFLNQTIAERILDRLLDVKHNFTKVAIIGLHPNQIQQVIPSLQKSYLIYIFPSFNLIPNTTPLEKIVVADDEWVALAANKFDLVISHLQLHWVNDVPGTLVQFHNSLKSGGLFLASLWGELTLQELRQVFLEAESQIEGGASPRVSPMVDIREAASLLQRVGFEMPIVDTDTLQLTYDHPLKLLQELRSMGETNALTGRQKFLRRDTLLQMITAYQEKFSNAQGRIPATFQALYLSGWKK